MESMAVCVFNQFPANCLCCLDVLSYSNSAGLSAWLLLMAVSLPFILHCIAFLLMYACSHPA